MGSDETLKAELAKAIAECERLREENTRLRLRLGKLRRALIKTLSGRDRLAK